MEPEERMKRAVEYILEAEILINRASRILSDLGQPAAAEHLLHTSKTLTEIRILETRR
jgi:hypothetical protein